MKKVYYSELLNKYFDDEEECIREENAKIEAKRILEEKKAALEKEKLEDTKLVKEAFQKYLDLKKEYIKKYSNFNITAVDDKVVDDATPIKFDYAGFINDLFKSWE